MVTASGLMLGFTFNFAVTWVQTENPMGMALAYFIGACVLFGTVCLIWAVFRILNHGYPGGDNFVGAVACVGRRLQGDESVAAPRRSCHRQPSLLTLKRTP